VVNFAIQVNDQAPVFAEADKIPRQSSGGWSRERIAVRIEMAAMARTEERIFGGHEVHGATQMRTHGAHGTKAISISGYKKAHFLNKGEGSVLIIFRPSRFKTPTWLEEDIGDQ